MWEGDVCVEEALLFCGGPHTNLPALVSSLGRP